MKLLLTSSGIGNVSIRDALGRPSRQTDLRGRRAHRPYRRWQGGSIRGKVSTPFTDLGWGSVGVVLELSVLPSIKQEVWFPRFRAADALLFWGGDPLYLSYWMRASGVADLLASLEETVYVGTSAGAMVTASVFGETYTEPRAGSGSPLTSADMAFGTPGDVSRTFVTDEGMGLLDFALNPQLEDDIRTYALGGHVRRASSTP